MGAEVACASTLSRWSPFVCQNVCYSHDKIRAPKYEPSHNGFINNQITGWKGQVMRRRGLGTPSYDYLTQSHTKVATYEQSYASKPTDDFSRTPFLTKAGTPTQWTYYACGQMTLVHRKRHGQFSDTAWALGLVYPNLSVLPLVAGEGVLPNGVALRDTRHHRKVPGIGWLSWARACLARGMHRCIQVTSPFATPQHSVE